MNDDLNGLVFMVYIYVMLYMIDFNSTMIPNIVLIWLGFMFTVKDSSNSYTQSNIHITFISYNT